MIFETLWPLLFLAAIPFIILLYLLKPKGKDVIVSSNLLWKKFMMNEQSQTFFEKFIHNILMYLQILILLLLILSFMSPLIKTRGKSSERIVLILDTSASMQMQTESGSTRFEEAVKKITGFVRSQDEMEITLITANSSDCQLITVNCTDKNTILNQLKNLSAGDSHDDILSAHDLAVQIANSNDSQESNLIICTDGNNASILDQFPEIASRELWIVGDEVNNVSNNYLVFTDKENDLYDVIVNVTNHANCDVSFEITLTDEENNVLAVNPVFLKAKETTSSLFKKVTWHNDTCQANLTGFSFADGRKDSLTVDNISYGIKEKENRVRSILFGKGNKYIENAYQAILGKPITKADTPPEYEKFSFFIYDVDCTEYYEDTNALIFGGSEFANGTIENAVLNVENCDLTYGLEQFTLGVNSTKTYDVPEWGTSFLEIDGKSVGYYGEHDGIKEIVVGFDLRETDLALRPEFPIFLVNAINFLTNNSVLTTNDYFAGEKLLIEPWADIDTTQIPASLDKSGLFELETENDTEYYSVRVNTDSESDGSIVADSAENMRLSSSKTVKKTLRSLLLILAIALLIIEWMLYVKKTRYQGRFYKVLRLGLLLILILALFNVKIPLNSSLSSTVFLVDMSNSNIEHQEEIHDYLRDNISKMPKNNQYGIICFGKDTSVEQILTKENNFMGLMSLPNKSATNMEYAISKALSMLPEHTNNRIVFLTDGKQTMGELENVSTLLANSKVELLSILYESKEIKDAYIENVSLPGYLHPNDKYEVTVAIESNFDTDATLYFYYGTQLDGTYGVHLNKGKNEFIIPKQVTDDTIESLQIVLKAEDDECAENDVYTAYAIIEDTPKILLINNNSTDTSAFLPILDAINVEADIFTAKKAPTQLNELLQYKSIITANVYAPDLPTQFLDNLETYVKDYGGGFICCGGTDSFALGGYRDTSIEKVLPVNMSIRNINENPSITMVMIIDRSGSMCGGDSNHASKLDLAIKAAIVAVDNLTDKDKVGVLTFDDQYSWQVPITSAENREEIKKQLKQIASGGGTTIKPALYDAFQKISNSDTSTRHVILLTDGQGETTNYDDTIKLYQNSDTTLSTIAVGGDSDVELLEKIAESCNGRYYYTFDSSELPKIFAQEVFLGSDSYIQEGDIGVNASSGHEITKNLFTSGWPLIHGYIAASPKNASRTLISSTDKDNPILTVWQYGLGHTAAWNCDISGEWSGEYSGQKDYANLWKRIIDYSIGNASLGEDTVDVKTVNNRTTVTYTAKDYTENTNVVTNITSPDNETTEVVLHAVRPGVFESEITTDTTGLYNINVRREDNQNITNYTSTACAVQFSDEYKYNISNQPFIKFIDKNGTFITEEDYIWNKMNHSKREKLTIMYFLLALGIILFLIDITMRRLELRPNPMRLIMKWKKKDYKKDGKTTDIQKIDTSIPVNISTNISTNNAANNAAKPFSHKKKKEKKEPEQTLDTSTLLKKKEDRNL